MNLPTVTGVRLDPLLSHHFMVSLVDTSGGLGVVTSLLANGIGHVALGGFAECSGLEMTMQPEEYKEGGRNAEALHFPGRIGWSNLGLKKGMGPSTLLWDWLYGYAQGRGRRRDGMVMLLNEQREPAHIWFFRRGMPVKYGGPALNAAQSNVAIETLEIAHEGLYQVPGVGAVPLVGGMIGGAVG